MALPTRLRNDVAAVLQRTRVGRRTEGLTHASMATNGRASSTVGVSKTLNDVRGSFLEVVNRIES